MARHTVTHPVGDDRSKWTCAPPIMRGAHVGSGLGVGGRMNPWRLGGPGLAIILEDDCDHWNG